MKHIIAIEVPDGVPHIDLGVESPTNAHDMITFIDTTNNVYGTENGMRFPLPDVYWCMEHRPKVMVRTATKQYSSRLWLPNG